MAEAAYTVKGYLPIATATASERPHHALAVEALTDEVAVQPLELAVVRDPLPPTQPLGQRRLEQRLVVDPVEDGLDRLLRERFRDAGALDLHPHAQLPAPLDRGLRARDRLGDARVVQRALVAQPRHRGVDRVSVVSFARQALAHLLLGELAAREQLQAVDICGATAQSA